MSRPIKDLVGQHFSFWLVKMLDGIRSGHTYYWAECSCGRVESVQASNLKSGSSEMCFHCSSYLKKHDHMPQHIASSSFQYPLSGDTVDAVRAMV